jgi:broad specificity phosphatase PhoE
MGPLPAVLLAAITLVSAPAPAADDLHSVPAPAAGVTRLYLVRHGQALSNLDKPPDLPKVQLDHLTDLGHRQAAAAGRALSGLGIGSVLVSPAQRAKETAKDLAKAAGVSETAEEERLGSLKLGKRADGHDLTWPEREAELRSGRDPGPPGGESMEAVAERVGALVRELARRPDPKPVVLVSHGEVIASWLGKLDGVPSWKRYPGPRAIANGAIVVVDVTRDGRATVRIGAFVPSAP